MDMLFYTIILILFSQNNFFLTYVYNFKLKKPPSNSNYDVEKIKFIYNLIPDNARLTIIPSNKPFGGITRFFYLRFFVSSELLNTFTKGEIKYVILHEYAHCMHYHNYKEFFTLIFLIIFNLTIIVHYKFNFIAATLFSLIIGLFSIYLQRISEYQADKFALSKLETRAEYLSATDKLEKAYGTKFYWFRKYFSRGIPFEERKKLALERFLD